MLVGLDTKTPADSRDAECVEQLLLHPTHFKKQLIKFRPMELFSTSLTIVLLVSSTSFGQPFFDVPGTYATIQAALTAATPGGTVRIAPGTYTGPGNYDLDAGGKSIVIRGTSGASVTILDVQGSATTPRRGFVLSAGTASLVIEGLTIRNGYALWNGGGVLLTSSASPTIRQCVFESCVAADGGAISVEDASQAWIQFCTFRNCSATTGGAIRKVGAGNLSLLGCSFFDNTSTFAGGALVLIDGPVSITNCGFSNNSSAHGGVAWIFLLASVSFSHCQLSFNAATTNAGGAIICQNSTASVSLNHCSLFGNTAHSDGGALQVDAAHWEVNHCNFFGNTSVSGRGGAISANNATGLLNESELVANVALYEGGGIDAAFGGTLSIENSLIDGNTSIQFFGGGVNLRHGTSAIIADATITNNSAVHGSGLNVWAGSQVSLTGCRIAHNQAAGSAGAVQADGVGSSVVMTDCTIDSNTAPWTGGILASSSSTVTVIHSTITANSATVGDGGGFAIMHSAAATFRNCKITGNTAVGWGGGGHVTFGEASFEGCLFALNTAGGSSSALQVSNASGPSLLTNCTFAENAGIGSCVGTDNSTVEIRNSILWGNTPVAPVVTTYAGSPPTISYSCLNLGWPGIGNISADPLLMGSGPNQYRPSPSSPAINAASSALVPAELTTDLGNGPRILHGTVDMGAFEESIDMQGTADDLELASFVDGVFGSASRKVALAGSTLDITLISPNMGLVGGFVVLVATPFPATSPPPLVLGVPGLHLDFFAIVWLVDGGAPPPFGAMYFGASGLHRSYVVPPGLSGTNLRLQGAVLGPMATNGSYAISNAQEIEFL